jgi:hypothetical protein
VTAVNPDQRAYRLAGPDGTTSTVHGADELARRIADAHEAGICLAFNGIDTSSRTSENARHDGDGDEF